MKRYIQLEQVFIVSAAVLLLLTGVAKLFSLTGSVGILDTRDPLFSFLNTRQLLFLVAVVEIGVGIMAFLRSMAVQTKLLLIAWLATLIGLYRMALWSLDYQEPCSCLGSALQWTGFTDSVVQSLALAMLIYLLVGSCGLVASNHWRMWVLGLHGARIRPSADIQLSPKD